MREQDNEINWDSLIVANHTTDNTDYILHLEFKDGTVLTPKEMEPLHDEVYEWVQEMSYDRVTNDDGATTYTLQLEDSDLEFEFELEVDIDLEGEDDGD